MNGLGCVMENKSGLCVDFHTMSCFCQMCAMTGAVKSATDYQQWWKSQKETCHINHSGSAKKRRCCGDVGPVHGAQQSPICINDNRRQYKNKRDPPQSKPYPGMKVRKDECVNYVAKRMGKGLRTLVDTKRKQKITLGVNGKGRLTEKK